MIDPLDVLEGVVAAVVVRADLDRAAGVGREAEDDDVVRHAREHLSPKPNAAELVLDGGDPVLEIERTPVPADVLFVMAAEEERHVAEHLIAGLAVWHAEHRQLGERVRLLDPPSEQEPAHLRQSAEGVRVVAVGRPARPDAVLVEDQVSL